MLAFFNTAYADGAAASSASSQSGMGTLLIMLVVFFVFSYILLWRPQSQRAKQQRAMLDALAKGDEVATTGGIIGKITKLTDSYVVIAIAENVEITFQKAAISTVLPKGTMKSI